MLILVGAEKKPFYVHKSFLYSASQFFEAMIEGSFKEAKEEAICLPEDDPAVFEDFSQWVYTKKYENVDTLGKGDCESEVKELRRHIDLFIFADKVQTIPLKHHIINLIHSATMSMQYAPLFTLPYLCEAPDVVKPLVQVMMAYLVWHNDVESFSETEVDWGVLRENPQIAIDYLVFAGLKYGKKKVESLFDKGPAYFYDDVLKKHGLKYGGKPLESLEGSSSSRDD